ncbi:uncharacterized protein BJ171DRAFT_519406 [Polychytrium aggregatum]|uniref:uncharacterized protein n=1 Tax=Polychytrium aggregatum TaxID=110093 RepID=UPI0022FE15E8|nr:uncharacterized protein BJ171DRAFT_519406 [Polychytrium aggregatum]KAI9199291.1 hypothetical protein BJ171DRAFT_519406 [Polychytrium aggregatum]
MSTATENDAEGTGGYKAKSAVDAQKDQIERLMKRVDRDIEIKVSKEKEYKGPKDFVRNVTGSSAGAGSGEFHVYRALRRKEQFRMKLLDEKERQELENKEFHEQWDSIRQKEDEKTAKNREKRNRRKQNQRHKQKQTGKSQDEGNGAQDAKANQSDDEAEERADTEAKKIKLQTSD